MKKSALYIFIGIVIILALILFYLAKEKATICIEDISLINARSDVDYSYIYGFTNAELKELRQKNSSFKFVRIKCKCTNLSFIRTLYNVECKYDVSSPVPPVIVGNKLSTGSLGQINITPRKTENLVITGFIAPFNYSDDEILEQLKGVKIILVAGYRDKVHVVSEPFDIRK